MTASRRVNARDVAQAGSLGNLIDQLIEHVRSGAMEMKEKGAMFLDNLCKQPMGLDEEQTEQNAVLVARAGAIKPLVALVIIGSPVAQMHACSALAVITDGRSEYQEQVVEYGGVLAISGALRAGDPSVQEQAAAAIASISQLVASQKALIKAGAVQPLVQLLRGASDDTHIYASFALAHLAHGNSEGQNMIASTGAIPLLVNLLGSGKAQEAVATAVARLTQKNEENQALVTRLGGVPKLIALLSAVNTETQAQAAAALAALASGDNRDEQDVIAQAGGIRPLLALVESRYASAQCSSVNALAMLAVNNPENQESIANMGGIMPLITLTHQGAASTEVQAQAVLALSEISRNNPDNQTTIAEYGAISSLAALLRHGDSQDVKTEVAGAFWTLSENHPKNKVSIASASAVQPLILQLAQPSERAHSHAANALASLAFGNEDNQAEIAAALVAILEEPPGGQTTQDRAVATLWRIVRENPANDAGIAQAGGAESLVRLLRTKPSGARSYALWSLSLSISPDNQKVVADEGGIKPLVAMLNDRQQLVCEQAACAIKRLAYNNKDTQAAITKHGAIEPLIALLDGDRVDQSNADRSQEYAAAALSELAQIMLGKTAIDRGGGIQPLVALLSEVDRNLLAKQYAAAALARLSADEREGLQQDPFKKKAKEVEERRQSIVSISRRQSTVAQPISKITKAEMIADAGAITPLVNLLSGTRGEEAQQEAAGALWALADHASNRMAITEAGGIGPLVMLLGCTNAQAREHAELALVRLSIETHNRVIIIEQLVGMLEDSRGTALQEQAAAALANLAKESEENRTSILKAEGVPRLLHLLNSTSPKAKENSASAISELAHQSLENQRAIANAGGIPMLVSALISASTNVKEASGVHLCCVLVLGIWHMADGNRSNQSGFLKEGAIPHIVQMITNPDPEMQTNAAGSLACLSRDHPDNQAAIARSGAIPPLCTMVREGANETREESAAALWALATDNAANKATIAKLGGIEPLVNMLMFGQTEKSSINAAGALAALAAQHTDNRSIITKRMVNVLGAKAAAARAVRLLSALASLCDNEPTNQVAIAKSGGVQHLINWLSNTSEEVQVQAARAMLAVSSNNSTTQSLIGKLGGIQPLVTLIKYGILEAQENAACALWHLATLKENRAIIKDAAGIPPIVALLLADGKLAPQVSSMLIVRLAEGSTRAATAIADAGGVRPLVSLLSSGTPATQQMAAAALAAIGSIWTNRDGIANAGAIEPLIKLIWSETLGTPETAARALSFLAQNDVDDYGTSAVEDEVHHEDAKDGDAGVDDAGESANTTSDRTGAAQPSATGDDTEIMGAEARRLEIKCAGGLEPLVKMLDGSNLKGSGKLKPGAVGGWASVRIGVAGAIELQEIFPGSQVDFRIRIGMQEQAAATLADLAYEDETLQDAIIDAGGVPPLLSLVQFGSSVAQEFAARTIWYLATTIPNQHVLVDHKAIPDLVELVKTGSNIAQEMAAAALSVLAQGYIEECGGTLVKASSAAAPSESKKPNEGLNPEVVEKDSSAVTADATKNDGEAINSDAVISCDSTQDEAIMHANSELALAESVVPDSAPACAPAAATDDLHIDTTLSPPDPLCTPAPAQSEAHGDSTSIVTPASSADPASVESAPSVAPTLAEEVAASANGTLEESPSLATVEALVTTSSEEAETPPEDGDTASTELTAQTSKPAPFVQARSQSQVGHADRLMQILDVGGIPPLVKLAEVGTDGGKEKAASALWHLALDPDNQVNIASNGGIKPLVNLLADGTVKAQRHASDALTRLATNNPENQAQIAKRLVDLLNHDDAGPVSRAAHDLQALAQNHPGAPVVIVNAGAISPLVTVLSNGKTHEGREEAARTLHTLANSGAANQLAIAIGLVALLGVGTDEAQEYVTALLLNLSSGLEEDLHNRKAIADAGPFKMLVQQLRSESIKVKMLAAAVMSKLSGDSANNVAEIAKAKGVKPLVALLSASDPETQAHAAIVLSDMTRVSLEHAVEVAKEGGIPLLVKLLTTGHNVDAKAEAAGALGNIAIEHAVQVGDAGAILPLVQLLESGNRAGEKQAAKALAGIAAGGEKNQNAIVAANGMQLLVKLLAFEREPEKVASSKPGQPVQEWDVQMHAAQALGALCSNHPKNQASAAENGSLLPIISLITESTRQEPKEQAAFALWKLTSACYANQVAVAEAAGISALVSMVGNTTAEGQRMAAEALASLALQNVENQVRIAELLIKLLKDSPVLDKQREKAARAISRFAAATPTNQDALATAGGVELIVSFIDPRKYDMFAVPASDSKVEAEADEEVKEEAVEDETAGKHHLIQRELSSAIWSMSYQNSTNQQAFAKVGGIPLLIALTEDDPEIHRNAAGALWSLAANADNQKTIADDGALPRLVELLKTGKKNRAQETASGALRSLAERAENRDLIEQAGGITHLVSLFDGGTDMTKEEVTGALLTLVKDNPANQKIIIEKLVTLLQSGPDDAREATNTATISKVAAQGDATNVLYYLSLDRDNKDALYRTAAIFHLVRQLKGGSDRAQKLAADALTQVSRITVELRIQVTQHVIGLLSNTSEDVRKRAGSVLHNMNTGTGEEAKHQKEAALASGVSSVVELLKDGLKHERIEPQEYALWSLSITADPKRGAAMVKEGIIPALIAVLNKGKISDAGLEYATNIMSCLALDRDCHDEVIQAEGIAPLVRLLGAETVGAKKHSARALARLALGSPELQTMIAEAGALTPLVQWLVPSKVQGSHMKDLAHQAGSRGRRRTVTPASDSPSPPKERSSPSPPKERSMDEPSPDESSSPSAPRLGRRGSSAGLDAIKRLSKDEGEEQPAKKPVPRELKAVAALALADLARDNNELQSAISQAGAMKPLIIMLTDYSDNEGQRAACSALATLAQGSETNQIAIAKAGGIPPLTELLMHTNSLESAARAISMLVLEEENKTLVAQAGGIEPLVGLLRTGNEMTKHHAAYAIESLALQHGDNLSSLASLKAYIPLVDLLSSDDYSTAVHATGGLLSLAEHLSSQKAVTKRLVDTLSAKSISAQLKAAEALATLASRSSTHRSNIAKAGAISPLVALLGNGQRADAKTPPERAASVLSDLARIAESKTEIAQAGGIAPLVKMLSSSCASSQTSASIALFHLSTVVDIKTQMSSMKAIPPLVRILSSGTAVGQFHAAGALWQLATSASNKSAIVDAGGIGPLVELLTVKSEEGGQTENTVGAPTPRRRGAQAQVEHAKAMAQENAAAVLAELARSQGSFRLAIARAGGIAPLIEIMKSDAVGAQKHATCAIWGLTAEPKFRSKICSIPGAVERLVDLLRTAEGETQGFAAATLVGVASEEAGREAIQTVGGAGPLMTIALGPDSWMRSQCVEVLKLMGYEDPSKKQADGAKQISPRMIKFQEKLAANPDLWMCKEEEQKPQAIVNDEHMSDLACKISTGQRVIVRTGAGTRQAEVMYIGKIPDIAPGWWVGVQYDEAVGKNDGSVKGERYFDCPPDMGGFLRPDRIEPDPDPPPSRVRKAKEEETKASAPAPAPEEVNDDASKRKRRGSAIETPEEGVDPANDAGQAHPDAAVAEPVSTEAVSHGPQEVQNTSPAPSSRRRSTSGGPPVTRPEGDGSPSTIPRDQASSMLAPASTKRDHLAGATVPNKPAVRERPKRFSDLIDVRLYPTKKDAEAAISAGGGLGTLTTGDSTVSAPVVPRLSVRHGAPRSARRPTNNLVAVKKQEDVPQKTTDIEPTVASDTTAAPENTEDGTAPEVAKRAVGARAGTDRARRPSVGPTRSARGSSDSNQMVNEDVATTAAPDAAHAGAPAPPASATTAQPRSARRPVSAPLGSKKEGGVPKSGQAKPGVAFSKQASPRSSGAAAPTSARATPTAEPASARGSVPTDSSTSQSGNTRPKRRTGA